MKKTLAIILCLIMVAAVAVSTISADEYKVIDARELQAYGQYHFYLGEPKSGTEIPDVTDGKISAGEYEASFEAKVDPTGVDPFTRWADHQEGFNGQYWDNEWSKFYVDYDEETIYFGYETKDPNFVPDKERVCHMISMWDVGTTAGAVGRMNFLCKAMADGSVNVAMQNFRKAENGGWNWDEKLELDTFYNEGSYTYDEATQILTIEISTNLVNIKEWWGNDHDLEDVRMYWAPYAGYYGESVEGAGDMICQGLLWCYLRGEADTNLKMNFILDYPDISYWGSPMMFPHIVHFCEEPEETEPPVTTTAPVDDGTTAPSGGDATTAPSGGDTTTAPSGGDATTAPSGGDTTTAPSGGDTTTAPTADSTTAPAAPATTAPATTKAPEKKGCGGTIALSALALVPMLGAAVVFGKKKED